MNYDLLSALCPLAEPSYRDFHTKLVPGLDESNTLGIRIPILRKLARELAKGPDGMLILNDTSPDRYYEETIVRGAVIGCAKLDTSARLAYVERFVPYIKNWALCDTFVSGLKFKEHDKPVVRAFIEPYLHTSEEFPARFGAVMLLSYFVCADHLTDTLERLVSIPATGYNAQMAVAWTLAECMVKFPEETLAFLKANKPNPWTYRKTLQKSLESRRLPDDLRPLLKQLRKEIPSSSIVAPK